MTTISRQVSTGRESVASHAVRVELNDGKLSKYLAGAMKQWGIPPAMFTLYREVALDKWDNGMNSYASGFDVTSPDYQQAAQEYNSKLKQIRDAMEQTTKGKRALTLMSKKMTQQGENDEGISIPIPEFNEQQLK